MSLPKGDEVQTQAQSAGGAPSAVPAPCPSGDVPREGSRDIQQKGKIISVPHDWCKSTDSPVPYKIWAWQSSSSNLANSVRQTDCRSHVLGSTVNQCYGDEPGTGGGVKSGTNLAECTPLSASPTVRAENRPMVRYLDKWWMNHGNTWGCLNNSEDLGKYDAPKAQAVNPNLYLASAAAPAIGGAGAAGEGWSAGQVASTVGSYASRAVTFIGEGGMAMSGLLAGGILIGSTSSTASPEQDQPFPHGIPPSTPVGPQSTSPPPTTPTAQQPTSPPPSTPVEQQPTSPPPSTPIEQQPTSPPPSTVQDQTGPQSSAATPAQGGTAADTERTRKAKEVGDKLADDEVLGINRNGVRISNKYKRPNRWRNSARQKALEKGRGDDGKLYDPNTQQPIDEDDYNMGHDPGNEFWKQQEAAQAQSWSRQQFLQEYNESPNVTPESPSSNQGHSFEDPTNRYTGKQ